MDDARRCGTDPDRWWPVAHRLTFNKSGVNCARLGPLEVIVLRDSEGKVRVFEDACPHKRVRLSVFGKCTDESILCGYHGWQFSLNGTGTTIAGMQVVEQKLCLKEFPVRHYGGWIWAFLGNVERAQLVPLPVVPPADNPAYHPVPMQGLVRCHYSIMTENATDLFHAELHKTLQPWANPKLVSIENDDRIVRAVYEVDTPRLLAAMISSSGRHLVNVTYDYPYFHLSSDDGAFYLFVVYVPSTTTSTWVHSTFYFRHIMNSPWILRMLHPFLNYGTFRVVFEQDMKAVEEEQRAYNLYKTDLSRETNPVTHAVRRVIIQQTLGKLSLPESDKVLSRIII